MQVKTWFQNQRYNYKRQGKEQNVCGSGRKDEKSNEEMILSTSDTSSKLQVISDNTNAETELDFNDQTNQSSEYSHVTPTNPFFPLEHDYTIFASNYL